MIKRVISFMLAFCVVFSCLVASAEEDTKVISGNETDYQMLCELGILKLPDNTVLKPEDKLFRKYAAMISVKLAYGTESAGTSDLYGAFNDLEKNDPLYTYAKTACESGFMSSEGGNFEPDKTVTFNELIKILTCAGGYGSLAEVKGGYPTGYLYAGAQMGITKGALQGGEAEMTVESALSVLAKCIEADLMEPSKFENGLVEQEVKSGKTFLDRMDIKRTDGFVTANVYTNIYANKCAPAGCVYIDGKKFKTGTTDITNYAGAEVSVFYKGEDSDAGEIIYFKSKSKHFEEKIIKGSDISEVSGISDLTLKYYENADDKKEKKLTISKTAREFFNEVYNGGSELERHINEISDEINGSIRLFDNDGDGIFDVVHLSKFDSYMVGYVDTALKRIYVEGADINYIDLEDGLVENLIVIRRGEVKSISDIKEQDIIQYSVSKDGKTAKIVAAGLSSTAEINNEIKLEGRVVSIVEKDGIAKINIDGLTYETTVDFWKRNKNGIVMGRNYVFYMNSEKQIAYVTSESTGEKYGFLMGIGAQSSIDGRIKLKILTTDNTIEIFETTNGFVHFDGDDQRKIKTIDDVYSSSALFDTATGKIKRQVVRYYINDWNVLSSLSTAKDNFRFFCVPATEINDDGTWKENVTTNEYSEEDFILRKTEIIDPTTTEIFTNKPGSRGGMVPVTCLAPETVNEADSSLQLNYTNFDVGKYIADDKTFSFFKYTYHPTTGDLRDLTRNSMYDSGDRYVNGPGKISWVDGAPIIDQKYFLTGSTRVFKVALELDSDGNISISNTAGDEYYCTIDATKSEGQGGVVPWMLYDINEGGQAATGCMGDISTLEYGSTAYTERGVLTEDAYMAVNSEGEKKLAVKLKGQSSTEKEYFFEDINATDTGCMLPYYKQNGEFLGPGAVYYYGTGGARKSDLYADVKGIYQGTPATDLKLGDFVSLKFNNKGEIKDFYIMFDGDTTKNYYEVPEGTDSSRWRMNQRELNIFNAGGVEYETGGSLYTSRSMGGDDGGVGLNQSKREFLYGKVKEKTAVGNYFCTVVETALPSWTYRDRIGSTVGSHDQYYMEESGNTYLNINRLIDVNKNTKVYVVDSKRKTVTQKSVSDICAGDKVAMSYPMYSWRGVIVVYKED